MTRVSNQLALCKCNVVWVLLLLLARRTCTGTAGVGWTRPALAASCGCPTTAPTFPGCSSSKGCSCPARNSKVCVEKLSLQRACASDLTFLPWSLRLHHYMADAAATACPAWMAGAQCMCAQTTQGTFSSLDVYTRYGGPPLCVLQRTCVRCAASTVARRSWPATQP